MKGAAFLLGCTRWSCSPSGASPCTDSLTGQSLFGIWLMVVTLPAFLLLGRLDLPPGEPVVLAHVGAGLAQAGLALLGLRLLAGRGR